MTRVLFVCTGNIFRSMTAEYALRRRLGPGSDVHVASAGTAHRPDLGVRDDVAAYLHGLGLDVSGHRRRTLTPAILAESDRVIAMNVDHLDILREQYGFGAELFLRACVGDARPLPDVDDLFPPDRHFSPDAIAHVRTTIDLIIRSVGELAWQLRSDKRAN